MPEDQDPQETQEWRDALDSVVDFDGADRAAFLLDQLHEEARRHAVPVPYTANTPYVNTIPVDKQPPHPGDLAVEHRIRSLNRWNAVATVLKANKESSELGGHIASFQSSATLYDTGFNHFWHAPSAENGGDLLFVQGHVAPGIYARVVPRGPDHRGAAAQASARRSAGGGLSSYPHPWLMPDYWQFPTVSMGLAPLMSIYQARFLKYLNARGLADTANRHVWAFLGDGEMDEPESLGAIGLASREKLDNLIWVINCNLQRLDGPVRGNGKIIQELEGIFRGAGWNVLKVIWGSGWDPLLAADKSGLLLKRMEECVDGEYQDFKSKNGAYVREHFFGKYPELLDLVKDMTDDQIWALSRGGHDPSKVYAAYKAAVDNVGTPTVILAKTVKGYGMGEAGEGQNITHQQKKMGENVLRAFRDRFKIVDLTDEQIPELPFLRAQGGQPRAGLPARAAGRAGRVAAGTADAVDRDPARCPELSAFDAQLKPTGGRTISTTMAFVRILTTLLRDKQIGKRVVPIVPDESRHLRHGGPVPPVRDLVAGRAALPARRREPAHVLQGGQVRPDAAGGHQRGRRHVVLDRGRHQLLGERHPDDPVLRLLLDVRLPAHRRPRLGRGRQPGTRVPARRHRRADHAQRRGPAARRRPQPPDLGDDPELRLLRPHLRPRGGGDHPGRAAADVHRAGGRLLLPHPDERELRAPRHAARTGATR